ncbi:hypothetical protein NYO91_09385 [Arhodomonas aquaeolei]|uniref:HNH endonuclease n=1 Tax=Arhodomonas aquaeolei TaxID=2369 RepID=UPI00216A1A14|nr:HNH endonuclease domain-containing protein [Arhodomonas aquaeolei]MCS4504288.1 hypothetical protein [Arhodomonas aquaeolei]
MTYFYAVQPTLEDYWRSIILFGRNVASYKFALGTSLLQLAQRPGELITLDELAVPFVDALCQHLKVNDKQATSQSSRFLDACRAYNRGEIDRDQLVEQTVRSGFQNVIDAFHNVHGGEVGERFFLDERKTHNAIRVTDGLFRLAESPQFSNLAPEVEARWRLVETAWDLGVSRNLIDVGYEPESQILSVRKGKRRVPVTSSRDALNGYQKGHCFYCYAPIIIEDAATVDVDHVFPHVLQRVGVLHGLDGVWNLVLACPECNRGESGKRDQLVASPLLERLYRRNEYLIGSHHPLRETLIRQTGCTQASRRDHLQATYVAASKATGTARWHPEAKGPDPFPR